MIRRCAVCRTSVESFEECPHGIAICWACPPDVACGECAEDAFGEHCSTCGGAGEVWDGVSYDRETGAPVTVRCPGCSGSGERAVEGGEAA